MYVRHDDGIEGRWGVFQQWIHALVFIPVCAGLARAMLLPLCGMYDGLDDTNADPSGNIHLYSGPTA